MYAFLSGYRDMLIKKLAIIPKVALPNPLWRSGGQR